MSAPRIEIDSSHRDADLSLASSISNCFSPDESEFLLLTGSYSIEAITGAANIKHNDLDMNVFTNNVSESKTNAIKSLNSLGLSQRDQTQSGLEYEYSGSLIELEFVHYDEVNHGIEGPTFKLADKNGHEVYVSTTQATILDNEGRSHCFNVKTLPFALATWALRISGVVETQKRPVRQTDVDHFGILLQTPHDRKLVIEAIAQHPQMPLSSRGSADMVLNLALGAVNPDWKKDE